MISKIFIHSALLFILALQASAASGQTPNVLLILVDDLKPALGAYGDELAITPNMDKLAERGTTFELAYCNQAICAPSRNNLMLGTLSTTSGLYALGRSIRRPYPNAVTLQQHFMNHGYKSIGMGKVFHIGHGNPGDPDSFDEFYKDKVVEYLLPESRETEITLEEANFVDNELKGKIKRKDMGRGAAIEIADVEDEAYADGRTAARVIEYLNKFKKTKEPFFISAGFARPHLPFSGPKKYFDMHPLSKFSLPKYTEKPKGAPSYALRNIMLEMKNYFPCKEEITNDKFNDDFQLELMQGYYATTSYVDAQIGKIINELDRLGMTEDTLIVLWGDHGWHMGNHGRFSKHDNYEQPTRIPLIFAGPGIKAGAKTRQLASTVDLYPSLAELAGLPAPKGPQPIDGLSMVPVLKDPDVRIRDHITHCYPKKRFGWAIRSERYRMVQWGGFGKKKDKGEPEFELYDMENDPLETVNIADQHPEIVAQMREKFKLYPNPK